MGSVSISPPGEGTPRATSEGDEDGVNFDHESAARIVSPHLKFSANDGFQNELRRRVDSYFQTTGQGKRDCPLMYLKTLLILSWFLASYILLVFVAVDWWQALPLAISLGLSMAAIGFNIMHDGGHHAYSNYEWINRLMARTLDLIGVSSYLWHWKHAVFHHTYVNIQGEDTDIDIGCLARLTPHQARHKFHRWQHLYMWPLYGFLTITWQCYDNFRDLITGKIKLHRFPRPKGWDLVIFIGGKLFFFTLAFLVPMLLHPVWQVLLYYLITSFILGSLSTVVFQLAHCVEEAAFPVPPEASGRIASAWAVHQVETTVNFAPDSRLACWFLGGLNFQIEHHLFPRICHIHYPALAKLVEQTCRDFGIRYAVHRTIWAGIASHFRWLRSMGMP
jgi:linoleoyl-CoA desaturase